MENGGFPWLFVYAFNEFTRKYHWQMLDLNHSTWHAIPEMPSMHHLCPDGLRCVSIPKEGTIFVCGVVFTVFDIPLNLVMKYEMSTNSWSTMLKMNTLIPFSAESGVIGGNSPNLFEPNFYIVLDVEGKWQPIRNLGEKIGLYDVAVMEDMILIKRAPASPNYDVPKGYVFYTRTHIWGYYFSLNLRKGWIGSSIVVLGHLFVLSEAVSERTRLKVFDEKTDSLKDVIEKNPFPDHVICRPFSISCCDDMIFVVGLDLRVAVGNIGKISQDQDQVSNCDQSCGFSVNWEVVDAPRNSDFLGFKPYNSHILLN
ncbi:F-box/kelch-repeat protein At1g30090-like [Impatiens glandulifera]|uniref:F-box/kelch-repeat protein At1g30090-like n=1 Tax=Impatiens glandulifera TaxID=253017 RepID=UPI001FB08224|nr:F-box/kelch-repeat protein At1g30090-like [Impatiens glandulifera]